MREIEVHKVLTEGTVRQKIKLFYHCIAVNNTIDRDVKGIVPILLSEQDTALIFASIKDNKAKKYYEELRVNNRAFLMFMNSVTHKRYWFFGCKQQINKYASLKLIHRQYKKAINDTLATVKDKQLTESLLNTFFDSLNNFQSKYSSQEFIPFHFLHENKTDSKVKDIVLLLNKWIIETRGYIDTLKMFLDKELPLQPYKLFLKTEEDIIKADIKECIALIKGFIEPSSKTVDKDFDILSWEDVEVEVEPEDLQDIKNAGL